MLVLPLAVVVLSADAVVVLVSVEVWSVVVSVRVVVVLLVLVSLYFPLYYMAASWTVTLMIWRRNVAAKGET